MIVYSTVMDAREVLVIITGAHKVNKINTTTFINTTKGHCISQLYRRWCESYVDCFSYSNASQGSYCVR